MLEIPPVKDTDAEDVVWGLQTADTLWKRGERIDALVWLRRAAQAAGDANDDDRALELARSAAELTEWVAGEGAAPEQGDDQSGTTEAIEEVIEEAIEVEESIDIAPAPAASLAVTTVPPAVTAPPPSLPISRPVSQPTIQHAETPNAADDEGRMSVLPAEKVHAGMFDPWAESSRLPAADPAPPPPAPAPVPVPDEEEVITSVRPNALSRPGSDAVSVAVAPPPPKPSRPNVTAKPPTPPKPPPPLPPRARPPVPKPSAPAIPPAPSGAAPAIATEPPAQTTEVEDVTSADVAVPEIPAYVPPPEELVSSAPPPAGVSPVEEGETEVVTSTPPDGPAADAIQPQLDLENVEAFADLPDDARSAFAAAAKLHALAEGEEIGAFALAYILSGAFDVAATVVDAPAVRLSDGAVLRARGTTDENVPIRLICAKEKGVIATWSDASVEDAFRTIPWVEEDLRAAADRVQTLVGITIGPLGERLDVAIREEIVGRLTMRPLIPGEVVVKQGEPVPGLLLIGIGDIELVKDDEVVGHVSSGEFLFATEVLGAGSAPATARAGAGGALVMFGDRRIAQELLVTCPPLLEVFAGM